jgi:hypothetical protein
MTQTIQATGKTWKLIQLCGTLGILFAAGVGVAMAVTDVSTTVQTLAMVSLVLTVPCYVIGRFGAWWFHG